MFKTYQEFNAMVDAAQEYAPYNGMPEFWRGVREYLQGKPASMLVDQLAQQAYDRGAQCAMEQGRLGR